MATLSGEGATTATAPLTQTDRTMLIVQYLRALREDRKRQAEDDGDAFLMDRYTQAGVAKSIGLSQRQYERWEAQVDKPLPEGVQPIRLKDEHFSNLLIHLGGSFDDVRRLRTGPIEGDGMRQVLELAHKQAACDAAHLYALGQVMPNAGLLEITSQLTQHPELIPAVGAQLRLIASHLPAPGSGRRRRVKVDARE